MTNPIALISVYLDLGAGRRGVDMGPSAIRIAGLAEKLDALGFTVTEMGAIHAQEPEDIAIEDKKCRYITEVADVNLAIQKHVQRALQGEQFPLILGGDHSLAIGTVSGVAQYMKQKNEKIGVIWVDAHADMNTPETTPGTPSLLPENVTIIGARDIDPGEKELIRQLNVRVITMSEIDERGVGACIEEAIERASQGNCGFSSIL